MWIFRVSGLHFPLQLTFSSLHFACPRCDNFPFEVSLVPEFLEKLRGFLVPKPGETHSLFQASATVFSIAAVYLYFAGYIFCYFYYFVGFGVTLESLDLSTQFYLMRAYTCLGSFAGVCFVLVMLLIIAAYLKGALRTSVTLLAMLAAFPVLFYISSYRAQMNREASFCNPASTIQFRFKEPQEKAQAGTETASEAAGASQPKNELAPGVATSRELMALGQSGQLSLLLETKDRIVVFRKPNCHPMGDPGPLIAPKAEVYTLLRSDVEFSNVMP